MIMNEVWQRGICFVRDEAAVSLSCRCDIDVVFTALDELADEKPPKVHDLGDPFLMAKVYVVRYLQGLMTSEAVQLWLDEFSIELSTPTQD